MLKARESPVCSICFLGPQAISLPSVLESRASQDEAGVYFLCLFTYHLSKYLLISYCVPGIVLGAEDSAVTKYIKLHRTLCSLLYP